MIGSERRPPPPNPPSTPSSTPSSTAPAAPTEEPSAFARLVRSLGNEMNRGEAVMRAAMSGGGQLEAGQLLALQAGVYRYSESVDLAAKLVERGSSSVKTVVQGQ